MAKKKECYLCIKEQKRTNDIWALCAAHYQALIDSGKKTYNVDWEVDLQKDLIWRGHHDN